MSMRSWIGILLVMPMGLILFSGAAGGQATAPELGIAYPVLVVSGDMDASEGESDGLPAIVGDIEKHGIGVLLASDCDDARNIFLAHRNLGCVVIDWDLANNDAESALSPGALVDFVRERSRAIPVFLISGKKDFSGIPTETLGKIDGYVRKNENRPSFIAGTMRRALDEYREQSLPPFFKALARYVGDYKYAWSTPGHAGGLGFLASTPGTAFYDFFGENILRADISSSMPEPGSILEHTGPAGDSEKEAALTFGADFTFFVLNGTSTANKMVWHSCVTSGDIVLVDRNCHKSIMHAIVMTRAVPVYLVPTRNSYGIIGPIHMMGLTPEQILRAVKACPLVKDAKRPIRIIVITNSTYDGLCYYVVGIKDRVAGLVENMHFDEAWYGYAKFSPLYEGRFGMSDQGEKPDHPPVFATQSTHKLLAAFSQGSMIHVKNGGKVKINPERFNEAYLMHASTSPFYPLFASIDVSAKMMAGESGKWILKDAIMEAIRFRKEMVRIGENLADKPNGWWFGVWQPEKVTVSSDPKLKHIRDVMFRDVDDEILAGNQDCWILNENDKWHGFADVGEDKVMLDPIKVTLLTPGVNPDGSMGDDGIPAGVVAEFLRSRGVVPEKVGHYSFLFLFAPGVTEGKTGTLIAKLSEFKIMYDRDASLSEVFPGLVAEYPSVYGGKSIRQLCSEMHEYNRKHNLLKVVQDIYSVLPQQAMLPADAYEELVRGNVEYVHVSKLMGRIPALMLVPYPPGIPVIMPGEKFSEADRETINYLMMCEDFDNTFPGFAGEIHGVEMEEKDGRVVYNVNCLVER